MSNRRSLSRWKPPVSEALNAETPCSWIESQIAKLEERVVPLFSRCLSNFIVTAGRFIDDGVLNVADEGVVFAGHEVGFGADINAHGLDGLGSLGG